MHGVCSDHGLSNSERAFTALPLATESVQTFGDDSYGNYCNFYQRLEKCIILRLADS